ncbi:uncharacterized protein LOC110027824 [Phalaenopsis equestris]|uniref:uncharacterized protein LOC110027824 n=1 Tax=Phalaenopsis equestris TaxID=78828 RepID=UPI0009E466FA|nr:uncharacterized protein LOC110027824 [Phalaenopsis equestris]
MWSRRNLYAPAIEILRREIQPRRLFLHDVRLHPSPSRISVHHFLLIDDSRASGGSRRSHHLLPFSRCSVRFWSSPYSTGPAHGGLLACWNCSEPSPVAGTFLVCGACRAVQPVDLSVDYFDIFGLERGYDIMVENLEWKYKEWQKKLHPDLVHSKSEKEKSYAAEQSARVIDAYRTLSNPLSRALYLLKLAGIFVDEEKTVMDPDLLSEMMEIREAVEEESDPKALMELQCQIQKKYEDRSDSFREAFNKRDFDSAIIAAQKMRYYERAIEAIVKKL